MLYFFVRLLMILSSLIVAYRGIGIPLLCSYLGGSRSQNAFCKQACVGFFDFLTLASYMIQDFFVFTNAKWCKRKKKSKYVQIVNKTL